MSEKKKTTQRKHFQKRMLERFGITISKDRCQQIIQGIQSCKYQLLEVQSLRVKKYLVDIDGINVEVIYDKQRKMLVTALPKNEDYTTS